MNRIAEITWISLGAALTVGLSGCDGNGPTAPRDAAPARIATAPSASRVEGPRRLKGHLAGTAVAGDPCSIDPPGVLVTATGHGTVSHLGATTLVQAVCVSVPEFLPLGPSVASLTAANGNRLDGLLTAVEFSATGFDAEFMITGGSGRFLQAAGQYSIQVVQSAPLEPFSATLDGWIQY